jgi:hypothetical protein
MASELPEDTPFAAAYSSTPTEDAASSPGLSPEPPDEFELPVTAEEGFEETDVEEVSSIVEGGKPVEIDVGLAEPEPVIPPVTTGEDDLEVAGIASEIEPQPVKGAGGTKEKPEESADGGPAEEDALPDEFTKEIEELAVPAEEDSRAEDQPEDWAEIGEDELSEEAPLAAPVDPIREQVTDETLPTGGPHASKTELSKETRAEDDRDSSMGGTLRQAWTKAKNALVKWLGK